MSKNISELAKSLDEAVNPYLGSQPATALDVSKREFRTWLEQCAGILTGNDDSHSIQMYLLTLYCEHAQKLGRDPLTHPTAIELLADGWQQLGEIQLHCRMRVSRAAIAHHISMYYYALGDVGAAIRWGLLSCADDYLVKWERGGVTQLLRAIMGVPQEALDSLKAIASENLAGFGEDWSRPRAFAEDVVRQLALQRPEYAPLLAEKTRVSEYPLSTGYFRSMVNEATQAIGSNKKGAAFEELASYLFLLLPGCLPYPNVLPKGQPFETDLVIRNFSPEGDVLADVLGRHFISECKNHNMAVGSPDVGYFLYRMRLSQTAFGVLFTQKGVTGKRIQENQAVTSQGRSRKFDTVDKKNANKLIEIAYHRDNSVCVVMDMSKLNLLADGKISFRSLLLGEIDELRFGRAR